MHPALTSHGYNYYSRAAFISFKSFGLCGYYSRVATILEWLLFEGGVYLKKYSIQLWRILEDLVVFTRPGVL